MGKNSAVILAAGAGTRMKSKRSKVLHKLCGDSMINHVINTVRDSDIGDIIVVVGNGAEEVKEELKDLNLTFAIQYELLGTAHAVMQAEKYIPDGGNTVVLCGDMPLMEEDTLKAFIKYHEESGNSVSVLTANMENPFGYGRIIKDKDGNLLKIVEQKDGNEEELKVKEINSGVYCFNTEFLKENLKNVDNNNSQKEYYLPDLVAIAVEKKCKVSTYSIDNSYEIMGINNRVQLAEAERLMRQNIVEAFMLNGVTFIDPHSVYIEKGVSIGIDTCIYPGVILSRNTIIGENCIIGQNSRIENSRIENDVEIQSSVIVDSKVGSRTTVGPFAYLRPNSNIGEDVKIGDFVEVKNSNIGNKSKASHLAYIGDGDIGTNVNIGCGVVFVNYDGKNKFRSIVEDNAFVGSNCNLVAPVVVKQGGYVAAGTTVTMEVPEDSLCVGRMKQRIINGWTRKSNLK